VGVDGGHLGPQSDYGRLNEVGGHCLTPRRLLSLQLWRGKSEVLILVVRGLLPPIGRNAARAAHIGTGALLALVFVRFCISPA